MISVYLPPEKNKIKNLSCAVVSALSGAFFWFTLSFMLTSKNFPHATILSLCHCGVKATTLRTSCVMAQCCDCYFSSILWNDSWLLTAKKIRKRVDKSPEKGTIILLTIRNIDDNSPQHTQWPYANSNQTERVEREREGKNTKKQSRKLNSNSENADQQHSNQIFSYSLFCVNTLKAF